MTRCCASAHISKWHVVAVLFQVSLASADLLEGIHLPGFEKEEPPSTTAQSITTTTTSAKVPVTNWLLQNFQGAVDIPLHDILMHMFALFMAVMFLVFWHVTGFINSFLKLSRPDHWFAKSVGFVNSHNGTRTFCQGVIVLQFYYSDDLPSIIHENPFICSCILLFIDSVFFWFVGEVVIKGCILKIPGTKRVKRRAKVKNVYMQISRTFQRTSMYFFVQFALMMFYVYSLNNKEMYQDEAHVSYLRWLVAMVLTAIAGEDEAGSTFDFQFWESLDGDPLGDFPTTFCCFNVPLRYQWRVRKFYSLCVNLIFRTLILGTAPVMLSVASPMDFIKDALAVFFITKLDDVDDYRDFVDVKKELMDDLEYHGYDVPVEVKQEVETNGVNESANPVGA